MKLSIILKTLLCVVVIPATAGTLTFNWSPSPDKDCVGYNLYYGPNSRTYTNKTDAKCSTSITVSNLPNVKLYFAVTAYDLKGEESDYSKEIAVIPK